MLKRMQTSLVKQLDLVNFVQFQRLALFSVLASHKSPQLKIMDRMSQLIIHESSSLGEQSSSPEYDKMSPSNIINDEICQVKLL